MEGSRALNRGPIILPSEKAEGLKKKKMRPNHKRNDAVYGPPKSLKERQEILKGGAMPNANTLWRGGDPNTLEILLGKRNLFKGAPPSSGRKG